MEKESTSFWADIKKYEDILAKDPSSYCFAPLSELYRKLGLLDDAVAIAKQGIEAHPMYIGGFMALGRALYEKGAREEAKAALEKVVQATPENLLAQRILSHIYQDEGDLNAAERALQLLVTFNPEDTESSLALEVLRRSMSVSTNTASSFGLTDEESEELPDLAYHAEQVSLPDSSDPDGSLGFSDLDDDAPENMPVDDSFSFCEAPEASSGILPLATVTLAELYEGQGFLDKALEVYRDLLQKDPGSQHLKEKISALTSQLDGELTQPEPQINDESSEIEAADEDSVSVSVGLIGDDSSYLCSNEQGGVEQALALLGQWLDAIRRHKECR